MMNHPFERKSMNWVRGRETDPRYGSPPEERGVDLLLRRGLVVLDKPRGPTSHQVASWVKDILGIDKAGHHGTLDPNTTGVLPIALGNSVRLLDITLSEGKEYAALMHLHSDVASGPVGGVLKDFQGEIYQMVPVRSAVKRELRTRRIHYMKLLERDGQDLLLLIGCESGTYIRTLIHDMGEVLGVGAHMAELRRTRSGRLEAKDAVTLQELRDAWTIYREDGDESLIRKVIRPAEELVTHLRAIVLLDSAVDAVCHGAPVGIPGLSGIDADIEKGEIISVMTLKGELVGIAEADMSGMDMLHRRTGQAAHIMRVAMDPGTYPRAWKTRKAPGQ